MVERKYEVIERDEIIRDEIICSLVEQPTQGVAYMCLRSRGPMSASDIVQSLEISDVWLTEKYNQAVKRLAQKGLIREVRDFDELLK